jgi:HEAT repeat protein
MRNLLYVCSVGLVAVLAGCGKDQPTTTGGGKSVDHWVQVAQGPDARMRKRAVLKLGNAGASDPAVVPALITALKDRDAGVRAEAALALLKIGPAAGEAVPALTAAQKDRDTRVRTYAARALEKVRGE